MITAVALRRSLLIHATGGKLLLLLLLLAAAAGAGAIDAIGNIC